MSEAPTGTRGSRTIFDGVLAWGLLFLLERVAQARVIEKVTRARKSGGRLNHYYFVEKRQPDRVVE